MSYPFNVSAAEKLHPDIRLGTSSWNYPGWRNIVYHRSYKNAAQFKRESLSEYVRNPWFRTVAIDSTFYSPPKTETLALYKRSVPEDFMFVVKAWEKISIPHYAQHSRYGSNAGKPNPDFLNCNLFVESFLAPFIEAGLERNIGTIVFQFQTINRGIMDRDLFFERLRSFLKSLPSEFRYSVEVRNPEYLEAAYFDILNETGATHCFNHWNYMPSLQQQMKLAAAAGGLQAPFLTLRALTPPRVSFSEAVQRFAPYNRLQLENQAMRKDIVLFLRRAIAKGSRAFVIVNNRAEGNSPITIDKIGSMAVEQGCVTSV